MFMSSATWAPGQVDAASSCLVASRTPCSGVPTRGRPPIPKIADMITSSVIACMRGASGSGRPPGQLSISRSATSAIICA